MFDIIAPADTSDLGQFESMALRLGIDTLYVVGKFSYKPSRVKMFSAGTSKADLVFRKADGSHDRRWLEDKSVGLVYGFELLASKDGMHQRNSGLNQIICKIAHDKGKILAYDFGELLKSSGMRRAQLLGRIDQNRMLCKKYKVKYVGVSFAKDVGGMVGPNGC